MTIEQHESMLPDEFIREGYLASFGIGSNQLSCELKLNKGLISRLMNNIARITSDIALRLSSVFGRSPESWLRMQDNDDLWEAKQNFNFAQFKLLQLA